MGRRVLAAARSRSRSAAALWRHSLRSRRFATHDDPNIRNESTPLFLLAKEAQKKKLSKKKHAVFAGLLAPRPRHFLKKVDKNFRAEQL